MSNNDNFDLWTDEENQENMKYVGSPKDTIKEAYSSWSIPRSSFIKAKKISKLF